MTTLSVSRTSVGPLLAELEAVLAGSVTIDDFVENLESLTAQTLESSAVPDMIDLRDSLRRVLRRAGQLAEGDLETPTAHVQSLDRMLVVGRTAAELRASSQAWAERSTTLRERIVAALEADTPLRPTALATRIQSGTPQVARVLRQLVEDGVVEPLAPPAAVRDKRGRWYALSR